MKNKRIETINCVADLDNGMVVRIKAKEGDSMVEYRIKQIIKTWKIECENTKMHNVVCVEGERFVGGQVVYDEEPVEEVAQ